MRVLITGAAGSIGRVVSAGLSDHEVVGLDLLPSPPGYDGEWHTCDCTDPAAVDAIVAASRPDAVVHLAGAPGEGGLTESLLSHTHTTAALLDAMVARDVRRIVYASSNHAVGRTPRSDSLGIDSRPRPDTFYGAAKVAAEGVLSLYADRYGIGAVSCRIGSFLDHPETLRHLSTWLSHDDCVRMVEAALTAPVPGYAVLYGISNNTRGWWDLGPGRALGYEPVDDAEDWADQIPARDEDEVEGSTVGGPFVTRQFERPAF